MTPQWSRGLEVVLSLLFSVDWTGFASQGVNSGFLLLFAEQTPPMPRHSAVESDLSTGQSVLEAVQSSAALRVAADWPRWRLTTA